MRWPPPGPPSPGGPGAAAGATPSRAGAATSTVTSGPPLAGQHLHRPQAHPADSRASRPTRPGTRSPWPAPAPAQPGHCARHFCTRLWCRRRWPPPPAAPSARFPSARCPRNQFEVSHPRASTISTSTTSPISRTRACPSSVWRPSALPCSAGCSSAQPSVPVDTGVVGGPDRDPGPGDGAQERQPRHRHPVGHDHLHLRARPEPPGAPSPASASTGQPARSRSPAAGSPARIP